MTNGKDSAHPYQERDSLGQHLANHSGLTKREYFAAMAMQGYTQAYATVEGTYQFANAAMK